MFNVTLCILAIILAVFLGHKTKMNTGIYGIIFAYLIGTFVLDMKPKEISALLPTNLFFILFSITFFYNFALENKALEKSALLILSRFNKRANLLPFVLCIIAIIMSAMGAGFFGIMALLTPITFLMCEKCKMDPLLGGISVFYGAIAGGSLFTSSTGAVIRGLIESAGYAEHALPYSLIVFAGTVLMALFGTAVYYVIFKGYKANNADLTFSKPEPFTKEQKTTLFLILILFITVILPYALGSIIAGGKILAKLQKYLDVGYVALILGTVAGMLKLGNASDAFKKIPWNTIIMLCGMGILMAVAVKAGITKVLSMWISGNVANFLIPIILAIVAGFMSLFSSSTGVVMPTLFPIVASVSSASGIFPALLFAAISMGSGSTGIFPFSSGGGLILSTLPDEEQRNKLYPRMMKCAVINIMQIIFLVAIMYLFIGKMS